MSQSNSGHLCKNQCGYYGNPDWEGFCSHCWALHFKTDKPIFNVDKNFDKNAMHSDIALATTTNNGPSSLSPSAHSSSISFRQSGFRRRILQTIRDNYPFSSSRTAMTQNFTSPMNEASFTISKSEIELNIIRFLTHHRYLRISSIHDDFYRHIKDFAQLVIKETSRVDFVCDLDTLSEQFKKFYTRMHRYIEEELDYPFDVAASGANVGDNQNKGEHYTLFDAVEDCLFRATYGSLYSIAYTECEKAESELQQQYSRFQWIQPRTLQVDVSPSFWKNNGIAVYEILKMDEEICPSRKLACIIRCCKILAKNESNAKSNQMVDTADATKSSSQTDQNERQGEYLANDNGVNADILLPRLIYALLLTRPTRLLSNMLFIDKFSDSGLLTEGDSGYSYTTFKCALQYITSLNNNQLEVAENDQEDSVGQQRQSTRISDEFNLGGDIISICKRASSSSEAMDLNAESRLLSQLEQNQFDRLQIRLDRMLRVCRSYENWLHSTTNGFSRYGTTSDDTESSSTHIRSNPSMSETLHCVDDTAVSSQTVCQNCHLSPAIDCHVTKHTSNAANKQSECIRDYVEIQDDIKLVLDEIIQIVCVSSDLLSIIL